MRHGRSTTQRRARTRPRSQPPRSVVRSPEDTSMLARVRALFGVGHYREAAAVAQQLVDSAHARKAKDLELDALNELGQLRARLDGPDKVAPIHHQVLALAEEQG